MEDTKKLHLLNTPRKPMRIRKWRRFRKKTKKCTQLFSSDFRNFRFFDPFFRSRFSSELEKTNRQKSFFQKKKKSCRGSRLFRIRSSRRFGKTNRQKRLLQIEKSCFLRNASRSKGVAHTFVEPPRGAGSKPLGFVEKFETFFSRKCESRFWRFVFRNRRDEPIRKTLLPKQLFFEKMQKCFLRVCFLELARRGGSGTWVEKTTFSKIFRKFFEKFRDFRGVTGGFPRKLRSGLGAPTFRFLATTHTERGCPEHAKKGQKSQKKTKSNGGLSFFFDFLT